MDPILLFVIFIVILMALATIRVPMALAILGAALACFLMTGRSLGIVAPTAFSALDVFAFLAVPAFIFAGALMLHGRIVNSILTLFAVVTRGAKGALSGFAIVISMVFGTLSGSSAATVSMVGGMLIPEMVKQGYDRAKTTGLIGASGVLGILIPPSIPGIMFAISSNQSVAAVWLVTVTPALLLGAIWIVVAMVTNRPVPGREPQADVTEPVVRGEKAVIRSLPALAAPLIIFVGIYGGIFTPTEAGAVVVLYSLLVGAFFYKGLNLRNIGPIVLEAAKISAAILILLAMATISARLFTLTGLPRALTGAVAGLDLGVIGFLIVLNVLLIAIGMFMETNMSIIVLTPILLPIAVSYGVDPLHFGAIMLLNLELGMITPPFAGNLFIACRISGLPFNKVLKPLIPYWLTAIPVLAITTFWPDFTLAFVHWIM